MEHRITISTEDKILIEKILSLVKDEDAVVKLEHYPSPENDKIVDLMNKLSKELEKSTIQDPVSWQRKIRKDRKQPFRGQ
ncbi:hypothetical protein KIH41_15920 [Litoribacter ruber]|uniref:Uncharacterized protein n=1 Tax=Litoribacter ruber TaxID=702568 RepID=A0AAP2G2B5_9BACT|nr:MULTISPECIES: hypothetical protein [Litoribacter]MBS9525517.1 hypothetical protein [Litoribacter alkaliphilus]MBT0812774.1 hypothetical protein [Litoribacter ruber]